jgi:hypothetical protein
VLEQISGYSARRDIALARHMRQKILFLFGRVLKVHQGTAVWGENPTEVPVGAHANETDRAAVELAVAVVFSD